MPKPQPLRLLILGSGAIGGYVGGRLLEAGADVTFLVREQRLASIGETGLHVYSPLGNMRLQPPLITPADLSAEYDIVLLTCKAGDLDAAVDTIAPAIHHDTRILPLLNGLAHFARLDSRFGRERVLGGLAHMAVERRADGNIHHLNDFHRVVFGSRHEAQNDHAVRLEALFDNTSLDCERTTCIDQALWDKFIFLATLAGATCLFRGSIGEILHTARGEAFILGLLEECIEIATAAGHPPATEMLADYRSLLTDRTAAYTASMLRDIQAGRHTEADHILGDMLQRAERHGISSERLGLAYSHLQVYEQHRIQTGSPAAGANCKP